MDGSAGSVECMAYEKLLNEIYAAVSLKYLWPEYQPSFRKSESPDWINETMELGLEVSQALLPDDGQTANFIEQYLGCPKEELPKAALERYGERLHFYNGRFWAVLPSDDLEQDSLYKAKYRFDRKLEKLNTNYRHMRYNGLYLFLHAQKKCVIDTETLFAYMREKQADMSVRYDWVFLNCESVIYVCDFRKKQIEPIVLPPNAESFLAAESEELRYLAKWENGTLLDEVQAGENTGQEMKN